MSLSLPPDPYQSLGVSKDAKLAEIRSAHRKLVLKCHPDKVQDATLKAIKQEEFQKVQQAYELLSDDSRRLQYDEQVKLFELRKEMGRGGTAGRTNPFDYEIRTAEPRANTYSRPRPREQPRVYSQPPPRSYEDILHDEPLRATARKSASYESTDRKRASREEERQRDLRKHEEDERLRAKWEKERDRTANGERKKTRDKGRRRGAEEKQARQTAAYVEDDSESDDHQAPLRSDRKSSRRMEEEIRMREEAARAAELPLRQASLTTKWDDHKRNAAQYMQAARRKVGKEDDFHPGPLRRAETFATPAYDVRYAAPPPAFTMSDDDLPRRSSARHSPPSRSRDVPKPSNSRRSPGAQHPKNPYIVEPPSPPPTMKKPPLHSHTSAPPIIPGFASPRREPSRSKTAEYPRQESGVPPLPRASTFQSGDRTGSRLKKPVEYDSDGSDSDSPIYVSPRHSRSPPPRRYETSEPVRYIIDNGRTIPISSRHRADLHNIDDEEYGHEGGESPRGGRPPLTRNSGSGGSRQRPTRSQSQTYFPQVPPEPIVRNARPKMAARETSHRTNSGGDGLYFGEVKFAPNFGPENVVYGARPNTDGYRRGSDPHHHQDYSYHSYRGGRGEVYT